ncbi:4-coumarate--CoA ligase [Noviherbaspirillum sp.]|uniref:4-coumarate--CoA ligase n=1 Tax=Noviherbaspirillum sp. TaxID=1926288 RepID=UPI002FE34042
MADMAWWDDEEVLRRFISDLVAAEVALLRPTGASLPQRPWRNDTHIVRDLGVDSLELLAIASALAEALHLQESGIEDYLLARPTMEDWIAVAHAGLQRFSERLTFTTSGSTGTPKRCTHPAAILLQEARELAALFPARRRILSAVPSHHIYGFIFTILLPRMLGLSCVPVIDLRGSSPAALARELRDGDLVIGHPEFWRAAVRLLPSMPAGVMGVTSTAPCPDDVSIALVHAGMETLVQIYGSSETAGVGWRVRATDQYRLLSHWERIDGQPGALKRRHADGRREVIACRDTLAWKDARAFLPTGRIDDAVQVGGINVFPAKVRHALMQHPDVFDASVRLMRADEGNRLKAFIVPRHPDADLAGLRIRLEAWALTHLATPERPKAFTFGYRLPTNAAGKHADWALSPDTQGMADCK